MTVPHPSARLLARYAHDAAAPPGGAPAGALPGGALAGDEVWAVEAHLESCAECRARLAAVVGERAPAVAALVDAVWAELEPLAATIVPAPRRPRWARRLATWMTPAMLSWLVMTALVTPLAVVAHEMAGGGRVAPVLVLAPVLPVLGVAASWARGLDPAYELVAGTPRAGLELVLRRTAAMLAVLVPVLLAAGWVTGVMAAQWLLPCLAFTTGTLVLGGLIGMTRAAVALVTVWAAVIVAPILALSRLPSVLEPGVLPVWGGLFVLGAAVVITRKHAYTLLGVHR
ncbi:membrane protein [Microtetraspora sp. NBRC 13810]|uniref:zf-HC2 domain-containing protein n=1 Tax=Microtetraspora sp. NBRC 13810 TaxID=3030990 RepID=UPI0024A31BF2|nr:zf-HC2 domain-containing protein [Microtetraspora sp. NBRC 13810]GLW11145.1 membrane protein [Microtetraspora sp. NBRC 13810]